MELNIGIDDTDSLDGMCTTYIGAVLKGELEKYSEVIEARLVRLNPNIEFKTRGNASISLKVETTKAEKVKSKVLDTVEKYAVFEDKNTNPGVIFFEGDIPGEFNGIYKKALHRIVSIKEAEKTALRYGSEVHKFKNGRGIVGALAAIGSDLSKDCTYEIIAYRKKNKWGTQRKVDKDSVERMDKMTFPFTFNNIDYRDARVLITPHTPCPVLFGIRGESPSVLNEAYGSVIPNEPIEKNMLYVSNQATDAHLEEVETIGDIKEFSTVTLKGSVTSKPKTIEGGHVIFTISDGDKAIDCAAYEPTQDFRNIVRSLEIYDTLKVSGGVKSGTINLEMIEILKLAEVTTLENPFCPICNLRMGSSGKKQGYRCRKCKTKSFEKLKRRTERKIEEKIYQVPPGAMRHLGKPLMRYKNTV